MVAALKYTCRSCIIERSEQNKRRPQIEAALKQKAKQIIAMANDRRNTVLTFLAQGSRLIRPCLPLQYCHCLTKDKTPALASSPGHSQTLSAAVEKNREKAWDHCYVMGWLHPLILSLLASRCGRKEADWTITNS